MLKVYTFRAESVDCVVFYYIVAQIHKVVKPVLVMIIRNEFYIS